VTGFEPFDARGYNTSSKVFPLLPEQIEQYAIKTLTLPVHWQDANAVLSPVLAKIKPTLAIGLGMSRESRLDLERIASNFRGFDRLDNSGAPPNTEQVVQNGPPAFYSDLPLDSISESLLKHKIPHRVSGSAGDYLCNEIFYLLMFARHQLQHIYRGGFIHVPPETTDGGWPLSQLAMAITLILSHVISWIPEAR
jgi:pyroglutamyl-peptidase